ncbi:MAG: PaaI family thioesterase [Proteobacteria bacterium]|nr:PaaI family thioesterase [Pseudomonadota bacterium]
MPFEAYRPPPGFHPWEPGRFYYGTVGPLFLRNLGNKIEFGFRCGEKHVNAASICHGGMLFTLMDIELGFNANVETGIPGFLVTVNMTSDFLAPVMAGQWVEAHGDVVKQTRSLVFAEGRLLADGEVVLRANAVLKVPRDLNDFDLAENLPPVYVP